MKNQFYDGSKLLSMKDINGEKPEIYICTSNRNAGKTTYFSRYAINKFIKQKKLFALLYRYDYDLEQAGEKFFSNVQMFFPESEMISRSGGEGKFQELFLDKEKCGYALALNNAKYYRQFSNYFSDVDLILFDEFQPEDSSDYVRNEIQKFRSIHVSIARGNGKQVRYVPVILIGNPYSLLNPYYTALNVGSRLKKETKFLRGSGWILEQGFNESAAESARNSAFNRAFEQHIYFDNLKAGETLSDNLSFISSGKGKNKYICTIKYRNKYYAIRTYDEEGIISCDTSADLSFPYRIAVTTSDMAPNLISIAHNSYLIKTMRKYFDSGLFRFQNLECKNAVFALLSISP